MSTGPHPTESHTTGPRATGAQAGWRAAALRAAATRVETLAREVTYLQATLAAREGELLELRESLAILDGRTRRHEATQDAVREMQQALASLDARLGEEVGLRREQGAAIERARAQEAESQQAGETARQAVAARLAAIEQSLASIGTRQGQLMSEFAERTQHGTAAASRLDALSDVVEALAQAARREAGGTARIDDAIQSLQLASRAIEARAQQLQQDQQRADESIAALSRISEREGSIAEVLEQQRTLRQQVGERLSALGDSAAQVGAAQSADGEALTLLRQRFERIEARVGTLDATAEAQREVLLEHFRRATIAAGDAGRRQAEEIERQVRAAQELLLRLAEGAEQASREQPL